MASLTGQTIAATYKRLLTIDSENFAADASAKYIKDGDAGTASALSLSTTRVGIGTTAPAVELHVKGGGGNILRLESTEANNAPHIEWYDSSAKKGHLGYGGEGDNDSFSINNVDNSDIRLYTNNTFAMIVQQDQKVGIGTTSPDHNLEIQALNATAQVDITTYDNGALYPVLEFRKSDQDTEGLAQTDDGDALGQIRFKGVDSGSNLDTGAHIYVEQSGSASTRVPALMRLETYSSSAQNTNQLVLAANGNVGIGITAPTSRLHVFGSTSGTDDTLTLERSEADISSHGLGNIYFRGSNTDANNEHRRGAAISAIAHGPWDANDHANYAPTRLQFYTNDDSTTDTIAAAPRMTIDMDGNVGIGDIAPEGLLCLNQGAGDNEIMTFKSSDIAHGMTDFTETDTYARFQKSVGATGGLHISGLAETGANIAMSLAGYPTDEDNTRSTSGSAAVRIMGALKSSATVGDMGADKNILVIRNNATTRFIFASDGTLHSDVANTTFSDSRLKSSVEDIPYGLAEVLQMQPKRFDKESGSFDESGNLVLEGNKIKMIGFMAQDIKVLIPEMVKDIDESSSFYSMEYGKLVSVLTKAIQELSAKVTALENA